MARLLVLEPDRKSMTPCSSSKEATDGDWSWEPKRIVKIYVWNVYVTQTNGDLYIDSCY